MERFATVRRYQSPVDAEMAAELLEAEGIPTRVSGAHARGVIPPLGAVEVTLQVPASMEARAVDLLRALDGPADDSTEPEDARARETGAETVGDAAGEEDPAPRRTTGPVRLKRVAVVCSFLLPGGAHIYCRTYAPGLVILLTMVASVVLGLHTNVFAALAVPFAWMADVLGALDACDVSSGAARRPLRWARALAWFAPLVFVALTFLPGFAPAFVIGEAGRGMCAIQAACGGENVDACHVRLADVASRGGYFGSTHDEVGRCVECAEVDPSAACTRVLDACASPCRTWTERLGFGFPGARPPASEEAPSIEELLDRIGLQHGPR